jgi:nitrate/nitrite transporter NarK
MKNTIHTKRCGISAWTVLFSGALFFFFEFLQMNMLNAMSIGLMRDFSLTHIQLAFLSDIFLGATIVFLIPSGLIIDRFLPRKVLLITLAMAVLGSLVFSLTSSIVVASICQFLSGIGIAFSFLICITLASRWFPPSKVALAIGLAVPFGMLGGVVAQTPLTVLCAVMGWRHAMQIIAGMGFLILLNAYFFVYDSPMKTKEPIAKDQHSLKSLRHHLKLLVKNHQNWLCGFFTGFLNLPIMIFGSLYGNMYFQQVYGWSSTKASCVNAVMFIGTILGSPLFGLLSDGLGSRRIPMWIGSVFSIMIVSVIFLSPPVSWECWLLLFFLLGFFTSAQVLSYPIIVENNPTQASSTATGLASVIIMGIGALSQPLFGWLMKMHWNGKMINGIPFFSPENYHFAMILLPACFVISILCVSFIRETHYKPTIENAILD